jgi:uracil-DNA glycosylase family 4
MPKPGPSFVAAARQWVGEPDEPPHVLSKDQIVRRKEAYDKAVNEQLAQFYEDALYNPFDMPVGFRHKDPPFREARFGSSHFVPGSLWDTSNMGDRHNMPPGGYGPRRARIMVIGKTPNQDEVRHNRNLVGGPGSYLLEMLRQYGIDDMASWYVTSLVKFIPPRDKTALAAEWVQDCAPLLQMELRIVRPEIILCLGADAVKAVFGKGVKLAEVEGRDVPLTYNYHLSDSHYPLRHTAKVFSVVHPAFVMRTPAEGPRLAASLSRFSRMLAGEDLGQEEVDIDHRVIRTMDDLVLTLQDADDECTDGLIAVDAEWNGRHPQNRDAYVRTIQFSWAHGKAANIVVTDSTGGWCFDEPKEELIARLLDFFEDKRVVGHYLATDLEVLIHWGLDLRPQYAVPQDNRGDQLAWERTRNEGGANTAYMAHAIEETGKFGLDALSLRYTSAPAYWAELDQWKKAYCAKRKIKLKSLEGYGPCPDATLVPYGNYDADVTLRIYHKLNDLLDCDYQGNCCREAYWRSMSVEPAVIEINRTGLTLDMTRARVLAERFMKARDELEDRIRAWAKWPKLNLRSPLEVKEFLFGAKLNGKKSPTGGMVRLRPPEAKSLRLAPIFDTSKRPISWAEIEERRETDIYNPSTNKSNLQLLFYENEKYSEQIRWFRDFRFVDQVMKSVLQPKDRRYVNEDSVRDFKGGIPWAMCDDGRVRTHIWTTKETGRWSSSDPPLQNISKVRDDDYARILGAENYKNKIRSMFRATRASDPGAWVNEDCLLIESDFTGAELCMTAWMSGDAAMIEHVRRNALPENDPDYYDIHSNVAVLAFRLKCLPTKAGLKSLPGPTKDGKKYLRDIAKRIMFGMFYGRGAAAISREAREQGVDVSVDEAQGVMETIFDLYPNLRPFYAECKARASNPGWICTAFGSFRRVMPTRDQEVLSEFERQFMNVPIQGGVAYAMSQGITNLCHYRDKSGDPDMFRVVLQVHDAVILEVPISKVASVAQTVMPLCLEEQVPVYPCTLSGDSTGDGPYRFSAVTEVFARWGERITKADCQKYGLPLELGV